MRSEVPVLRRCCFCLPLRYSLIVWGYFKLIIAALLLTYFFGSLCLAISAAITLMSPIFLQDIIILSTLSAITTVDIVLHILFLIGAHRKKVVFFKVYYIYSMILLGLTVVLDVFLVSLMVKFRMFRYLDTLTFSSFAAMFLNLLIQAYVILLVRSEIVKLIDIGSFRFVNNAAEAECKLEIEHPHEDKETSDKEQDNI